MQDINFLLTKFRAMKKLILVFVILGLSELGYGQQFYSGGRSRNFILGAGTGASFYFGDLAADGDFSNIKPNLAIGARYNFRDRFSVESQFTWFMLTGDDSKDPIKEARNLSFQSHNFELNLVGHISLFPEANMFYQRPLANPYLYAGIGVVNFNPTAKLDGTKHSLRPLKTEGPEKAYSAFTMSIPMGLGVKFRVTPFLNLNVDGGFRYVLSDYLDDVSSGEFPDPLSFESDIARRLSDRSGELGANPTWAESGKNFRGNPNANDAFFILNIKVEYFFSNIGGTSYGGGRLGRPSGGKRIKAPKQNKPKRYKPPKTKRRKY